MSFLVGSNPTPSAHISEKRPPICGGPHGGPIDTGCLVCGRVRTAAAICGWLCQIRAQVFGSAGLSAGFIAARDRTASAWPRLVLFAGGRTHRRFDAAFGFALLPGDAFGVDPQQHVHAVAGPFGDLGSRYASVEPG